MLQESETQNVKILSQRTRYVKGQFEKQVKSHAHT